MPYKQQSSLLLLCSYISIHVKIATIARYCTDDVDNAVKLRIANNSF